MANTPKVSSGDRIRLSANWLNKVIDLTNAAGGQNQGVISGNARSDIIFIKNTTGAYIEAQGILGVGDSILTPTADQLSFRYQRPVFEGEEPVQGTHESHFCILIQGLKADEVGPAFLFGVSPVQIDMINEDHKFATIAETNPTANLESAVTGPAKILFVESGTGVKWAKVQFPAMGGSALLLYKATADADSDGTITAKAVDSNGDTTEEDPEFTFAVVP